MSSDAGEQLYNKIDTFVFFDLETTDLIRGSLMPRILELSMVAVSRNSLQSDKRDRMALPRVMQKLTLIFNPMQAINYHASMVSNLWIDNLQTLKPFDQNAYNTIMEFLNRLPVFLRRCIIRKFELPHDVEVYKFEKKCQKGSSGGAGYRSRYLSHAKRALYHLSYAPC
ncbi:unnamed protein product [Trichogramma brassicae]|uniref:Exonuclease domain-containing protein n=1 Tax=Trichogramma brassicae TaxID=86971 RepID=A0A6H5IHT8_9HYME|nr:unnamed protein product [Trichogramma brassicae]